MLKLLQYMKILENCKIIHILIFFSEFVRIYLRSVTNYLTQNIITFFLFICKKPEFVDKISHIKVFPAIFYFRILRRFEQILRVYLLFHFLGKFCSSKKLSDNWKKDFMEKSQKFSFMFAWKKILKLILKKIPTLTKKIRVCKKKMHALVSTKFFCKSISFHQHGIFGFFDCSAVSFSIKRRHFSQINVKNLYVTKKKGNNVRFEK